VPTGPISRASVVRPDEMVYRPSSACTNTFTKQLAMTSQRRVKPTRAPRLVVAMSSPVPTIAPARISPGPICRSARPKVTGGASAASSLSAYASYSRAGA
jgi:hypothetical protein